MKSSREDLSTWALHFIHDFSPRADPAYQGINYDRYDWFPYHENKEKNDRFDSWKFSDNDFEDPAPDAFHVLLKIVTDGHIRATWAFRNSRPTIYGPRAAVCFTEMPLYALLEYADIRSDESVRKYAIGLLKHELFAAGGRPVIYGLSGKHTENNKTTELSWPRKLAPSCGISETEQYRYVAMSSDTVRPIDWSHEREWRWVDHEDRCSCPGLPVWLSDEPVCFSSVFIVVPDRTEAEQVMNRLQELYDAGANNFDHLFCRRTLEATSVIALDGLEKGIGEIGDRHLRLEDIPAPYILKFDRPNAPRELLEKVRHVLFEAQIAAKDAEKRCFESAPRAADGRRVGDVAGWAHLYIHDAQSPLVAALLKLQAVFSVAGSGYYFLNIGGLGGEKDSALCLAEAAVGAAKSVFEKHFPTASFTIETRWD